MTGISGFGNLWARSYQMNASIQDKKNGGTNNGVNGNTGGTENRKSQGTESEMLNSLKRVLEENMNEKFTIEG